MHSTISLRRTGHWQVLLLTPGSSTSRGKQNPCMAAPCCAQTPAKRSLVKSREGLAIQLKRPETKAGASASNVPAAKGGRQRLVGGGQRQHVRRCR